MIGGKREIYNIMTLNYYKVHINGNHLQV